MGANRASWYAGHMADAPRKGPATKSGTGKAAKTDPATKPRGRAPSGDAAPRSTEKGKTIEYGLDRLLQQLKNVAAALAAEPRAPLGALLEREEVRSPLVVVGDDRLRARRLVEWTKEHLFAGLSDGIGIYFGSDLGTAQSTDPIRGALTAPSLFAPRQLVVIYDADKVKSGAATPLLSSLSVSGGGNLVILTAADAEKKGNFAAEAAKLGSVIRIPELHGDALLRWIHREAARHKVPGDLTVTIEPEGAEVLARSWGNDLTALSHEIEKLALLADAQGKITRELVERISYRTGEVATFELVRQIARKNALAATALAHELVAQGSHPLQLSSFISRCLRTLLANHPAAGGRPHGELANQWFLRNLGGATQQFTPAQLVTAIEAIAALDARLKDSKLDHTLALTRTVQDIAAR